MHLRALRLEVLALIRGVRPGVLLAHSPPRGVGDDDDRAHQGFAAFHRLVRRLQPKFLVHGHIHPYGESRPDRTVASTTVVNAVGYRMLEMEAEAPT